MHVLSFPNPLYQIRVLSPTRGKNQQKRETLCLFSNLRFNAKGVPRNGHSYVKRDKGSARMAMPCGRTECLRKHMGTLEHAE